MAISIGTAPKCLCDRGSQGPETPAGLLAELRCLRSIGNCSKILKLGCPAKTSAAAMSFRSRNTVTRMQNCSSHTCEHSTSLHGSCCLIVLAVMGGQSNVLRSPHCQGGTAEHFPNCIQIHDSAKNASILSSWVALYRSTTLVTRKGPDVSEQ